MLDDYADTVPGGADYHLALWHGVNLPLLLSILVLAAGTAAFLAAPGCAGSVRIRAVGQRRPHLRRRHPRRRRVRLAAHRGHPARIHPGHAVDDPVDAGAPSRRDAAARRARPSPVALWDSPLQVVVGLIILAAALSATMLRNRLAAVLLVGVTGYGCGTIFVFHGAPDLALTQFLVETLTLVIFVLVLRALPAEADRANITRNRVPRAVLALAVGASVTDAGRLCDGRPHHHAHRRTAARGGLRPRPRRQHRQRAARRHPRLGHHGRDLGAPGRRDGRGINGVPAQALWLRTTRRRCGPARHRPHSRAVHQPRHRRRHLAAGQRVARPAQSLAGSRGRDADRSSR